MEDYSIVAEQITSTGPVSASGTLTVNAPATISGNIVASGFISGGGAASASVSVATANNTSIPIATRIVRVSATAVTTSGSCTLAVGTIDGQDVTLVNESANNIIISGNMKAAAAQTVVANSAKRFVWVTADTAWFAN